MTANPPPAPTPGLQEVETAIVVAITEPAAVRRWALGEAAVQWNGETYTAGNLLRLGDAEDALSAVDARLQVGFISTAADPVDYRLDPGPLPVTVSWLARPAGTGDPWEEVHREIGRLSGLTRSGDGGYSAEIEAEQSRIAGTIGRMWSNEDQAARYLGDRGFEFLARLAAGYPVAWPPEQGGRGIGIVPETPAGPEVPDQVTPQDGAVVLAGDPTEIDALGSLGANLYDPDQPLSGIVWRWERRDNAADPTPEVIAGAGSGESNRATYGIQAADVGKQVRAVADYADAKGPGRTAASPWVTVTAPAVAPGPPQDAPVLVLWRRTARSGGLFDWYASWEDVPGATHYQQEVQWASETELFPRAETQFGGLSSARTFRVRAWNEHGYGPWSAWASTTAPVRRLPAPTAAPTGFLSDRLTVDGRDYWRIRWDPVQFAGVAVSEPYEVRLWVTEPATPEAFGYITELVRPGTTRNPDATTHLFPVTARNDRVYAAVRAVNIGGRGPWSAVLARGF